MGHLDVAWWYYALSALSIVGTVVLAISVLYLRSKFVSIETYAADRRRWNEDRIQAETAASHERREIHEQFGQILIRLEAADGRRDVLAAEVRGLREHIDDSIGQLRATVREMETFLREKT